MVRSCSTGCATTPTSSGSSRDDCRYGARWLGLAAQKGQRQAQALLAAGHVEPDATEFMVRAERGLSTYGIVSNTFLERAFRTLSFVMRVTVLDDDAWSYEQETILEIPGAREPFAHVDHNQLVRVGGPPPNPLARGLDVAN